LVQHGAPIINGLERRKEKALSHKRCNASLMGQGAACNFLFLLNFLAAASLLTSEEVVGSNPSTRHSSSTYATFRGGMEPSSASRAILIGTVYPWHIPDACSGVNGNARAALAAAPRSSPFVISSVVAADAYICARREHRLWGRRTFDYARCQPGTVLPGMTRNSSEPDVRMRPRLSLRCNSCSPIPKTASLRAGAGSCRK